MLRRVGAMLLLLVLVMAGCGTEDDPVTEPDGPAEDPTEDPDGPEDGPLADATEAAVEDAAGQAGVDPADVEVVEAEEVTWSDGALGCPEPDMMYTQALVDGYRIVLEVEGETVHYHGEEGDEPFRCDDPEEPAEEDAATS